MIDLAIVPFCEFQISTQMTTMSDLGDALIIWDFDISIMLLKICVSLITLSMISEVIGEFDYSKIYDSLVIFKYGLDFGRQELSTESELIFLLLFRLFSMTFKSDTAVGLLVMIVIPLLTLCVKLAEMSDLISFRHLLMLIIFWLAKLIINSAFKSVIGIMICFLDGPFIIILILGFFVLIFLFVMLIISTILLADKVEKTSLIQIISLMFDNELILEAWAYVLEL